MKVHGRTLFYVAQPARWYRGTGLSKRLGHISTSATEDPFLGSGTTLAAAELTERTCLGLELDAKYVDVVIQRWQTLAGKKATLDGDGRTSEEIAQERRKAAA